MDFDGPFKTTFKAKFTAPEHNHFQIDTALEGTSSDMLVLQTR